MSQLPSKLSKAAQIQWFALGCFFIGVCWIIWPFLVKSHWRDWPTRGQFGDSFGGLNTLFTGLTFVGLVFTILLQKEEAQKRTLERELDEANEQALRKDDQKKSFEVTFFQLFTSLGALIGTIKVSNPNLAAQHFDGKLALNKISDPIQRDLEWKINPEKNYDADIYSCNTETSSSTIPPVGESKDEKTKRLILETWEAFYGHEGYTVAGYFRFLYHLFKFISKSNIENKQFYADLVRAQLSDAELRLLYYNCIGARGEGMRPYVLEFTLLKHLPGDTVGHELLPQYLDEWKKQQK